MPILQNNKTNMLNKLWPNSQKIGISKKDVHIKM